MAPSSDNPHPTRASMLPPDSALVAQETALYLTVTTQKLCEVATLTMLLYDAFLAMGREYKYVWRAPKSWISRGLYVYNRYMLILCYVLYLGTIPPISDVSCATLYWLCFAVLILNQLGPAAFTTLRIYALSRRNRIQGGVALVLSLTPFVLNAATAYRSAPLNLPAPLNCWGYTTKSTALYLVSTLAATACTILVNSLAIAVTWSHTRTVGRAYTSTLEQPSLQQVLWRNGNIYFSTLVSLSVVNVSLVVRSVTIHPGEGSYVLLFIEPVTAVLNSRFLLDLHETSARQQGAGTTRSSSSSLQFRDGDVDRSNSSPNSSELLATLGGSIHSFPDHELELWSPASANTGFQSNVDREYRP